MKKLMTARRRPGASLAFWAGSCAPGRRSLKRKINDSARWYGATFRMRLLTSILVPIFLLGACSQPVMPCTSSVAGTVTGLMADEQAFISVGGSKEFTDVAADGSYEVRSIPVGDDIFVAVSTDTGRSSFDRVGIIEGQKAILDFDLEGPGRLFGRITRGGRVTATRIEVRSTGDGPRLSAGGPTSREGHYDIAGLPLGEYEVSVLSRPHFYVSVNGETWLDVDLCNLPTPQTSAPVGKASVCDNLSLSGIVVASEDGRGLERATMSIVGVTGLGTQTATDGQGAFEFRDLAPGSYLLTVYRSGYEIVTRPILLQASMEGVTVMLEPTSGQSVRVWDRETGVPLGGSLQIEATDGSTTARLRLPLAGDGAAVLPTSLYGHDLTIGSVSYRTHHVSDWNGEPLSLALSTCQLFSKGCYPSPLPPQ